jgi:Tfp pilus assembly protein PilV
MNDIPVIGWLGIACIGVMVVVLNIGLIGLVRYRPTMKLTARGKPLSRSAQSWQNMGNMIEVLRDPFASQRSQMEQLSREVEKLEHSEPSADEESHRPV